MNFALSGARYKPLVPDANGWCQELGVTNKITVLYNILVRFYFGSQPAGAVMIFLLLITFSGRRDFLRSLSCIFLKKSACCLRFMADWFWGTIIPAFLFGQSFLSFVITGAKSLSPERIRAVSKLSAIPSASKVIAILMSVFFSSRDW